MPLSKLTSLTSKDRILLYLSDFTRMEDRYELPPDLIQETISYCTGVQRKHLSKYLGDLIKEGMVIERKAHIQGMKQRMNAYYLSPPGFTKACCIRDDVGSVVVEIRDDGKVMRLKVADIDDATPVRITYCDIVREAIQRGQLSMLDLLQLDEKKRQALEVKERASDAYKRALTTAWRDGRVTASERFLIEELRKQLKISESQHRILEAEILKRIALDHMEFRRVYRGVLEIALSDGTISGPEEEILENLRRTFMISRDEHEELRAEVAAVVCGPPGFSGTDESLS